MQDNKVVTASLAIIVIFIAGVVLRLAKPVLFPFFLAVFLSFVLSPALDFLTRLKVPKSLSIVLLLLVTFFILYLLGTLFYATGKTFASEFPKYGQKISSILNSLQARLNPSQLDIEPVEWTKQLDLNRIGSLLLSTLGPFLSFLSNLFLILLFLVFILAGRGKAKEKIRRSLDGQRSQTVINVLEKIDLQIQKYLGIKTIISFFTGVFVTVVLVLFGVNFAIVFGFLAFLLNYIPNLGSIIATALPVAIAAFQFNSLWPALWILIILMAIQMTMGNFIEPRLMGGGLGLSPLVVLFFLFFWGWLWGIPGMILAVPIAAVINIVCQNTPGLEFVSALMSKE